MAQVKLEEAERVLARHIRDRHKGWCGKAQVLEAYKAVETCKAQLDKAKYEADIQASKVKAMEAQRTERPRSGKSEGAVHRRHGTRTR